MSADSSTEFKGLRAGGIEYAERKRRFPPGKGAKNNFHMKKTALEDKIG